MREKGVAEARNRQIGKTVDNRNVSNKAGKEESRKGSRVDLPTMCLQICCRKRDKRRALALLYDADDVGRALRGAKGGFSEAVEVALQVRREGARVAVGVSGDIVVIGCV